MEGYPLAYSEIVTACNLFQLWAKVCPVSHDLYGLSSRGMLQENEATVNIPKNSDTQKLL